jgi:hypothetical protein
MESSENTMHSVYKFYTKPRGIRTFIVETWNICDAKFDCNTSTLAFYLSLLLSRSVCVTTGGIRIGEWIY